MNLSENLKQIRKDNNLSQEALAEMLGVSRQAVSKWESGTAYPEMDKVLQICKRFNVNLNDLMNENIKIAREKKENKNAINKFVDELLEYITKSINMFSTLNFKSKIICLFEQACILAILSIIGIIVGSLLGSVLYRLFMYVPEQIYNFISALCGSIYGIVVFILIAIIWLHIFKTRYLDYYKIINKDSTSKEEINLDNTIEYNKDIKKEPKIIIRDKTSEIGIFKTLFKLCIIFIKLLSIFISFFFITGIITLGILLIFTFIFNMRTLFFWGAIITIISLIIIGLICLKFIYDFIFNCNTRKRLIGIILGVSLLTTGIGIGLFTINILKMDYYEEIPKSEIATKVFSFPINDYAKYINIHPCDYHDEIKCEFIESDINEITVEVEHSKYTEIAVINSFETYNDRVQWIDITYYIKDEMIFKYINKAIRDLNSYKIYDLKPNKITIYAPKEVLAQIAESE